MVNTVTREEHLTSWLKHAGEQREKAAEVLRKAETEMRHWNEYTEHLEKLLLLEQERRGVRDGSIVLDSNSLLRLPVKEALIEIAKNNRGTLITRQAIKALLKAGVFSTAKAARDNVYSTVRRSQEFHKERKGVYVLVSSLDRRTQQEARSLRAQPSLSEAVDGLRSQNPKWGFRELVKALTESGFDFKGKNPSFAVNMVLARGHRKVRKAQQAPAITPISQQPTFVPQEPEAVLGVSQDAPKV